MGPGGDEPLPQRPDRACGHQARSSGRQGHQRAAGEEEPPADHLTRRWPRRSTPSSTWSCSALTQNSLKGPNSGVFTDAIRAAFKPGAATPEEMARYSDLETSQDLETLVRSSCSSGECEGHGPGHPRRVRRATGCQLRLKLPSTISTRRRSRSYESCSHATHYRRSNRLSRPSSSCLAMAKT